MAKLQRRTQTSGAAYTLVDLNSLEDDELRKDIIEDAAAGGGVYGIRVVEESVNGGARAPIYGYYKDGPDGERWASAKEELGLGAEDTDDAAVRAGATLEITDPRREAALREAAAQRVEAEAQRIRDGEESELTAITGEELPPSRSNAAPSQTHTANIVDDTLALDATNEAANAKSQDTKAASKPAKKSSTNKAPK